MIVQVKLFAITRELTGLDQVAIELAEGATIANLKASLLEAHPQLEAVIGHVMFAVDSQYAQADQQLFDGSEVALIPPVSGG